MKIASFTLALGIVAVGLPSLGQADVLRVASNHEKKGGFLEAVTIEALKRGGHQIKIDYLPWVRALRESMDLGTYDILLGTYQTPERQAKMAYSEPICKVEIYLFGLRSRKIRYATIADLAPLRIGIVRGAGISEKMDKANLSKVEDVASIGQNIRKLQAGRIDVFVDKKRTTLHILQTQFAGFADEVEAIEPPFHADYFYNAFPKNRPEHQKLLADFNRGLRAMKEDGTYDAILKRHFTE